MWYNQFNLTEKEGTIMKRIFKSKPQLEELDEWNEWINEEPDGWMDFADIAANVGPWLLIVIALAFIAVAL